MNKQVFVFVVALMLSTVSIFVQDNMDDAQLVSNNAVKNYLVGIKSDNLGLRTSCAYFIGEYKIEEGIIPLIRMLNNEKNEEARIMAALSLAKIGTGKSVYAIKQAAVFDRSERVRTLCARFYNYLTISQENKSDL